MEYITAFMSLIRAAGQYPSLVFIAGFFSGCAVITAWFKYFYVPKLDGSINRSAAAKESARDITRTICSLRQAAEYQDQDKRRNEVDKCVFRLRIVADIQTMLPYSFLRKRVDACASRAERYAIEGDIAAMEKAINKITRLIA